MNTAKKAVLGLAAAVAFGASSHATVILVGTWDFSGGGNAAKIAGAQNAIVTYNATHNPDLPALPTGGTLTEIKNGDPQAINFTAPTTGASFYYVYSKYGQPNGVTWDAALHFLLPGDVLTYNPSGPTGLSHYIIWQGETPRLVPDGGGTLALMGLALTGLGFIRRKAVRA